MGPVRHRAGVGRLVAVLVLPLGCSEAEQPILAKAGEVCEAATDCEGELSCDRGTCMDDSGPRVSLLMPSALAELDTGFDSVTVGIDVSDYAQGDRVEVTLDPDGQDPSSVTLTALDDGRTGRWAVLELAEPLASGPHHLRARVLDADGDPYPNPSATADQLVFAPDEQIPDTPQVGFVWPPPGHEHPLDRALELEVAVLPGSFAFTTHTGYGGCEPVPDCEPALAPECEDECGPVERFGHVKIHIRDDYPGCLLDAPINCNGDYTLSIRPGGSAELLDAFAIRSELPPDRLAQLGAGEHELHVALSYGDHDPYPTHAQVIHSSVRVTLVEPSF